MKLLLLIFSLFLSFVCYSQYNKEVKIQGDSTAAPLRSKYIKEYRDDFFLYPVLKQRRLNFEIQNDRGRKNTLQYKTNKPYSFGLGLYIFELGVEVAFAVPLDEQSKRIYGESDAKDFQINVIGKRWGIDAYHQRYSGYYLNDTRATVPANTPYAQRADIRTRNTGLTLNYTFNHRKFSFRSAYNFAERQLTSAGSPIVYSTISKMDVYGDSAIINDPFQETFPAAADVRDVNSFVFAVAPGYSYSIIYKGFFLNGALAIGPGLNWLRYETESQEVQSDVNASAFVAARIALGYNGDRFFGGMAFSNQGRNAKFENVELSSSNSAFRILFGCRFRESGILKKRVLDLPKAIGI